MYIAIIGVHGALQIAAGKPETLDPNPRTLKAAGRSNETAISLKAGCELFLRYATRVSALEMEDFAAAKARMIQVCCFKNKQGLLQSKPAWAQC